MLTDIWKDINEQLLYSANKRHPPCLEVVIKTSPFMFTPIGILIMSHFVTVWTASQGISCDYSCAVVCRIHKFHIWTYGSLNRAGRLHTVSGYCSLSVQHALQRKRAYIPGVVPCSWQGRYILALTQCSQSFIKGIRLRTQPCVETATVVGTRLLLSVTVATDREREKKATAIQGNGPG